MHLISQSDGSWELLLPPERQLTTSHSLLQSPRWPYYLCRDSQWWHCAILERTQEWKGQELARHLGSKRTQAVCELKRKEQVSVCLGKEPRENFYSKIKLLFCLSIHSVMANRSGQKHVRNVMDLTGSKCHPLLSAICPNIHDKTFID